MVGYHSNLIFIPGPFALYLFYTIFVILCTNNSMKIFNKQYFNFIEVIELKRMKSKLKVMLILC